MAVAWLVAASVVAGLPPVARVVVTVRAGGSSLVAGSFSYELGVWRPTAGEMTTFRSDHTASPLEDGTILVTGGRDPRNPPGIHDALSSAERYDPSAGTWTAVPSMGTRRQGHTATVLDGPACRGASPRPGYCGRVLVVGGSDRSPTKGDETSEVNHIQRSAELYDPTADVGIEWTAAASMTSPRYAHTATLLDGPACHATSPPRYCGKVLVTGGIYFFKGTQSTLRSAELYDPEEDEWVDVASMRAHHVHHSATVVTPEAGGGDQVLVVGGSVPGDAASESDPVAELYDPETGTWDLAPEPPHARFFHSATALGERGKVLVAGGRNAHSSELYTGDRWATTGPMSVPTRAGHTATLLPGGKVLAAGGVAVKPEGDLTAPLTSTELYDPEAGPKGGWNYTSAMTFARGFRPPNDAEGRFNLDNVLDAHTATLLDRPACHATGPPVWCGSVLVVGGTSATKRADVFTPPPSIESVSPAEGPSADGATVTIEGFGLASATEVRFDDVAVTPQVLSSTRITAVAPPRASGRVDVTVRSAGGSSLEPASFTYTASRPPAAVTDLAARTLSASEIELSFSAPGSDGSFPPPAKRYVIKQSRSAIDGDAAFDAARSLCTPECTFGPATVGQRLSLKLSGLAAGTSYYFALRAVSDIGAGPMSNPASATTPAGVQPISVGAPIEPVPQVAVSPPNAEPEALPVAAGPRSRAAAVPPAGAARAATAAPSPATAVAPATSPPSTEVHAPRTTRPPVVPDEIGLAKTPSGGGGPWWLLALAGIVLASLGAFLNWRLRA